MAYCMLPLHGNLFTVFIVWRQEPDKQSLSVTLEGGMERKVNILKIGDVLICKALGLTKMMWTQPKKYNRLPCGIRGHI